MAKNRRKHQPRQITKEHTPTALASAAGSVEGPLVVLENLPFINHADDQEEDRTDWSSIDPNSIGANFEILEGPPKKKVKKKRLSKISQFVTGKSPHLSYVLNTKVRQYQVKKPKAINAETRVSAKEKAQWANSLSKNIKAVSSFFEKELLPLTSALASATLDSQERYSQLVEDPTARLPLAYILRKAKLAAQLKICDHIAQVMKLSSENRRLLKLEFSRSVAAPNNSHPPSNEVSANPLESTK